MLILIIIIIIMLIMMLTCEDSAAEAVADLSGTYVAHSLQSLTAKSWQSTCA